MQIVVLCTGGQKAELSAGGPVGASVEWISDLSGLAQHGGADVFFDLLFHYDRERIGLLNASGRPVVVHSVVQTAQDLPPSFVRLAAWPGFLRGRLVEAGGAEAVQEPVAQALAAFGKEVLWLPDAPGFITPRVVSMIINEAYFALEEGVSTKEAIDTAMKLGTNYPFGPFEWAQLIGAGQVAGLLEVLSRAEPRYAPAPLLLQEAGVR